MNETTKNFLDVFANLPPWEPPVVLFRLYYNDQGNPIEYSHEDKPGNYIDVDPNTFRDQPQDVRVVNNVLVKLPKRTLVKKITPNGLGICCSPNDVTVVVSSEQPHTRWSLKTNETN